jgi:hypothetical protein
MLYGYGCKRALLTRFIDAELTDGALIVVNGTRRGATAKQVVLTVASVLLHSPTSALKYVPTNVSPSAILPMNSRGT